MQTRRNRKVESELLTSLPREALTTFWRRQSPLCAHLTIFPLKISAADGSLCVSQLDLTWIIRRVVIWPRKNQPICIFIDFSFISLENDRSNGWPRQRCRRSIWRMWSSTGSHTARFVIFIRKDSLTGSADPDPFTLNGRYRPVLKRFGRKFTAPAFSVAKSSYLDSPKKTCSSIQQQFFRFFDRLV